MSEHPDTRDLLGPYVMGTLEPHEEREVEDHLEKCASCRGEAQELRLAHERLADLAYSTETPPQDLKARVVAGMPRRETWRRVPTRVAAVAAALCVLAVLGAVLTPELLGARASANLSPTDRAPDAGGEVSIQGAGENVQMRLEAWGLPPCKSEQYYELWLVEGDERVSAGTFTVGQSGRVDVRMNAPNFAASYPIVGVTAEYDKDPRASDAKMLSGKLHEF
ncbi:MAG: anti-sigma factor [Actinomycetota bacterium]|nr:anti-sigma factor [Rubrobacteraceae bacterium]MDQ3251926.1 anti-sigma factor [Actinomycetota bacterium]